MSLRGQASSFTLGKLGRCGGVKAQWVCQGAPSSIHWRTSSICFSVKVRSEPTGGIRVAWSLVLILWYSLLSAAFPGTITWYPPRSAKAPSFVSRRRFTIRCFSSGPWQAKQLSERIGRISRLKSTPLGLESGCATVVTSKVASPAATNPAKRKLKQVRCLKLIPPRQFFVVCWWFGLSQS